MTDSSGRAPGNSAGTDAPASARLPWRFDAALLRADVDGLSADDWVPHFNTAYYDGDWSGAALRSVGGEAGRLYPDPAAVAPFADTPLLARCPATQAVLEQFRCPLLAVRYLRLGPGSSIREHRDLNLGVDDGEVRIHVPVSSDPAVEFLLDGRPVEMAEGEAWYLNLNLPHAVTNRGPTARVHLVVDCVVDESLGAVLSDALASAQRPGETESR
ncbi:MAG: aspartyl/asparaginyl beta-hydroxylase domain-containing protein [Actinomycetota bacterium]|nr:aspartyl/asparaginyl beta-hydroxylase domain-containing protein [Actinomycetota bacterium]